MTAFSCAIYEKQESVLNTHDFMFILHPFYSYYIHFTNRIFWHIILKQNKPENVRTSQLVNKIYLNCIYVVPYGKNNFEQCGEHNIVQACYTASSEFLAMQMKWKHTEQTPATMDSKPYVQLNVQKQQTK